MSEVFYRKWRPRRLDQVVGQEPVTQTLRQAVLLGRVAHAYLFCGPRGTGKTSTARILAKAVNCLSPQDGEPDNECQMCTAINEGRALDLIEIDAASNRGIDDVRNLSDKIRFAPNEATYKVYIIDEVHMMTEPAFNALLKTLEEPPRHAIFILATTEVHKVPLTIISRCQRFDFRRIPVDLTAEKLGQLCRDEDIEASPEALALIARTSRGSLRDGENLLEQVVVSYGSPVKEEQVRDLLGLGGDETALELVEHVMRKMVPEGLTVINQVAGQGNDLRQLHRGAVEYLRGILLVKSGAETSPGYADGTTARLKSLADASTIDHLLHVLKTFAQVDLRRDSSSPLPLELALVESATVAPTHVAPTHVAPTDAAEARSPLATVSEGPRSYAGSRPSPPGPPSSPAPPSPSDPRISKAVHSNPAERSPSSPDLRPDARGDATEVSLTGPAARLASEWGSVVRSLRHTGRRFKLGALLRGCKDREVGEVLITLKFPYTSHVERMQEELDDPATRKALVEVLSDVMDAPYDVEVSLLTGNNSGARQSAAQRSHLVRAAQAMGARVVDEKEVETS